MSLDTWKQEHYPVEADDASLKDNPLASTRHSLIKWYGLRDKVLYKHGLKARSGMLFDPNSKARFDIDSDTCALCANYYHTSDDSRDIRRCLDCPLAQQREQDGKPTPCDFRLKTEDRPPYHVWDESNNPEPMIEALEATYRSLGGDPSELED